MDVVKHIFPDNDPEFKKENHLDHFFPPEENGSLGLKATEKELLFIQQYDSQQAYIEELYEKNKKLEIAYRIIEQKNKDILDSITYALRIQQAILPDDITISRLLDKHFLLYLPKDIVSGDFYWMSRVKDSIIIVSGDCTGHGVPGAFMSFIGCMLLNNIVNEQLFTSPSYILHLLHKEIRSFFSQYKNEMELNDGMELAICSINFQTKELKFAGANRPLIITYNNELTQIKGDSFGVGGIARFENRVFTNHTLELKSGSCIYLYTDGFTDQFGGDSGKKFTTKKLQELLLSISNNSIAEKKTIVENTFKNWKGKEDQVDDVLLLGIDI